MAASEGEHAPGLLVESRPEGWFSKLVGEVGPWGLPESVSSKALVASMVVKSGAGTLLGFSGFNNGAAAVFIQVFDTQAILATGAVPEIVLTAAASGNFSYDAQPWGRAFKQGIVIAQSSTVATFTAVAANVWFDVQYV